MAKTDNYQIFVDWDNDDGLAIAGDFEADTGAWAAFGSSGPALSVSTSQAKGGTQSMRLAWVFWNPFRFDTTGAGFNDGAFGGPQFENPATPFKFNQAGQGFDDGRFASVKTDSSSAFESPGALLSFPNLVVGRVYDYRLWAYVPTGSPHVSMGVQGISGVSATSSFDTWQQLTYSFTATATTHVLLIFPASEANPANGTEAFIDLVQIIGPGEDVTARVLRVGAALSFSVGRDTARSLSAIKPGETALSLNNQSGDYSPDNPGSLLASFLAPGRPLLIRAEWQGKIHNLFRGFLDTYDLDPDPDARAVKLGALDLLGRLADATLSTTLRSSIQTGDAIEVILDEIGWPTGQRSIDKGASTIRWWWEEGATGLEALTKIVDSEGPPAIAYVDSSGNMVFRDRHHRLVRTASTTVQATFRDDHEEPKFSPPLSYDIGWRDIINNVTIDVKERRPSTLQKVWETEDRFVIDASSTRDFTVKATDPFLEAVTPVAGTDFIVESGTVDSVTLSRTSGQSAKISLTASASAVVKGLILRAIPVSVYLDQQIVRDDSTSQTSHGIKSLKEEVPWANANDASSIADLILGFRAERLPVVRIMVKNGDDARLTQILERKLSDRIHIIEMLQTFMDHDYFIEQINHSIDEVGYVHNVVFGCEKAKSQIFVASEEQPTPPPAFTFDDATRGFNDGYFDPGGSAQTSENVFQLDVSLLDTDGLGY